MEEIFSLREKKIIHYLANNDAFVTGKKLAMINGVSERTIRTDIQNIRYTINYQGLSNIFLIESEHVKGYKLIKLNSNDFNKFLRNIDYRSKDELNEESIKAERLVCTIATLLNGVSLYSLSNLVYYSEDKIMTLIKKRNEYSRQYYYKIVISKGNIKVIGKELEVRLGCLSTIFVDPDYRFIPTHIINTIFNLNLEKQISDLLMDYFKENRKLSISLLAIKYISKAMWVSAKRNSYNCFVIFDDTEKKMLERYKEELEISRQLITLMKHKLNLRLSEEDKYLLAIFVISFSDYLDDKNVVLSKFANDLCNKILETIKNDFNLLDEDMNYLRVNCSRYFRSFEIRSKFAVNRQYMGLTRIKRKMIVASEYSRYLFRVIKEYADLEVSNKELVFLSECISESLDTVKYRSSQKIVVASRYGYYEAKRVADNINKSNPLINSQITICEIKDIESVVDDCDLLVVDEENVADFYKEKSLYFRGFSCYNLLDESVLHRISLVKDKYFFYSQIKENNLYLNLNLRTVKEVFKYIVNDIDPDNGELYDQLIKQEKIMSFECGYKIAIISVVDPKYENCIKFYFLDYPILWHSHFVSFVCVMVVKNYISLNDYEMGLQTIVKDTNLCSILSSEPSLSTLKRVLKID